MKVTLLSGQNDPPYILPFVSALTSKGLTVEFIGNSEMKKTDVVKNKKVRYYNFRGDQNEHVSIKVKANRIFKFYINREHH